MLNTFSQPFLYLVTNRGNMDLEQFLAVVLDSVAGGVKMVQLREKNVSFREFCKLGNQLRELLCPLGVPLIINDRVDVAHAIDADGAHLGQSDSTVQEARKLLGAKAIIGLSINRLEEIKRTRGLHLDYVAASPVFPSKTKDDCGPPFDLASLEELCKLSSHPVVGIGGINTENVKQVINCGVKGVAVISAIFNDPYPRKAAQKLINRMENCNEDVGFG